MQTLLDNGYTNVDEMEGGLTAWTEAGYPEVTSIVLPDSLFTKITSAFTLIPGATTGTPIPTGSVITHWVNGITEVTGPDNKRILLARDSDATMTVTESGNTAVTWMYSLPAGASVQPGSNETKMVLNGQVILTIVYSHDYFTNN